MFLRRGETTGVGKKEMNLGCALSYMIYLVLMPCLKLGKRVHATDGVLTGLVGSWIRIRSISRARFFLSVNFFFQHPLAESEILRDFFYITNDVAKKIV